MNERAHIPGTNLALIAIGFLLAWTAWIALHRTVQVDVDSAANGIGADHGAAWPITPAPSLPDTAASLPDMRIDINSASVAELSILPAIGPGLAERIVSDRQARGPFASVDDLHRVSGIGAATIERLRPYATTGRAAPTATAPAATRLP
jgi:competence ComEA-like helix-hairpin-helix protein